MGLGIRLRREFVRKIFCFKLSGIFFGHLFLVFLLKKPLRNGRSFCCMVVSCRGWRTAAADFYPGQSVLFRICGVPDFSAVERGVSVTA